MKIIVGTKNEKKIHAVRTVISDVLKISDAQVLGYEADSKVPEAPIDKETHDGALNRALACMDKGDADYYVGVESGLVERYGGYFEESWAVILSASGLKLMGYSSGLMLPATITERMRKGEKHNSIMAHLDKELDAKNDNRDTWSRYTGGAISRQVSLEEALRNALIQLADSNRNLYR